MSTGKRIALVVGGIYLFLIVLTIGIFGWSRLDNEGFKPQNEFKLDVWVDLGPFSINKAVLYLVIHAPELYLQTVASKKAQLLRHEDR